MIRRRGTCQARPEPSPSLGDVRLTGATLSASCVPPRGLALASSADATAHPPERPLVAHAPLSTPGVYYQRARGEQRYFIAYLQLPHAGSASHYSYREGDADGAPSDAHMVQGGSGRRRRSRSRRGRDRELPAPAQARRAAPLRVRVLFDRELHLIAPDLTSASAVAASAITMLHSRKNKRSILFVTYGLIANFAIVRQCEMRCAWRLTAASSSTPRATRSATSGAATSSSSSIREPSAVERARVRSPPTERQKGAVAPDTGLCVDRARPPPPDSAQPG